MSVAIELDMPLPTLRNVARPHLALTAAPKPVTPPRRLDPASREQLLALLWKLPSEEVADVLEVLTAEMPESSPPPPAVPVNDAAPDVSGMVPVLAAPEACASDLVDVLFESMYELGAIDDGVEGARHCLAALTRSLPVRAAYVHFYDVEARQLVTVATSGREASTMLRARHPDNEWPVLAAVFKRAPLVLDLELEARVRSGGASGPVGLPRHAVIDAPKSVLIAPVFVWGRCLAFVELLEPSSGDAFGREAEEAVAYVSRHLGTFLAKRGLGLERPDPPLAA